MEAYWPYPVYPGMPEEHRSEPVRFVSGERAVYPRMHGDTPLL